MHRCVNGWVTACVPLPKVSGACTVQLATSPGHKGSSRLPARWVRMLLVATWLLDENKSKQGNIEKHKET